MWVQLFWLSALLDFCTGKGFWWWYKSESVNLWCLRDKDCQIDGETYLNEACVHQRLEHSDLVDGGMLVNFFHDYKKDPWTEEMKKEILKVHNTHRNSVAGGSKGLPKASNMRQMTWDDELEFSAFHTAKASSLGELDHWNKEYRPIYDHFQTSLCLKTSRFEQASQNRFCKTLSPQDVEDSIFVWYAKILSQPQDKIKTLIPKYSKPADESAEFLARLLWANVYKIACIDMHVSVTTFWDEKRKHSRSYVCNYAPEATIEGQPVYKEGEKCSACPEGTKCRPDSVYPDLCALDNDPKTSDQLNVGTTLSGPLTLIYLFLCIMIAINFTYHS